MGSKMATVKRSHLLINEPPLQVLPSLATSIGLNEAIITQQLHYWLENKAVKGEIDEHGNKWIYNTYEEWQENFPFWSVPTIKRAFLRLEEIGIVIAEQLNAKRRDMRKYYRIDYDKLCTLHRIKLIQSEESNLTPSSGSNLSDVKDESETTAETTAESIVGAGAPAVPVTQTTPKTSTPSKKKGDALDGILFYAGMAQDRAVLLSSRIAEYPQDCQNVLAWFVEAFDLLPSAIPERPVRSSKGGDYALWINELREVANVLEGTGRDGIIAAKKQCSDLSISHPGAIMWCLPSEVGKLVKKSAQPATPVHVDTPFARSLTDGVDYSKRPPRMKSSGLNA